MGAVTQFPTGRTRRNKTQCELVADHIETYGGITAWEAIKEYGITRLAARIHELQGTGQVMKAEDIGDGYVRYVPDYKSRLDNAMDEAVHYMRAISTSSPLQFNRVIIPKLREVDALIAKCQAKGEL